MRSRRAAEAQRTLVLPAALALLSTLAVLTGCGGGGDDNGDERSCNDGSNSNFLRGSYCEDTPMLYTEVKCLIVSSSLRIEYVRPFGTGAEKTLQVILDGSSIVLESNVSYNLITETHATVRRILADAQQPISLTQDIENTSTVTFTEYTGAIDSHAAGMFNILFKTGRTLAGDFDCTIQDARPES